MKMLLRGGLVLSENGPLPDSSILVDGGVISRIARDIPPSAADAVVACEGLILAPGFINTHNHMYGALSHGIDTGAVVTGFSSFLEAFWWPYVENRVDAALAAETARWACVEAQESGVTCFADILEAPGALPGVLEAERAVLEAHGMRAYLSFEACQRVSRENGELGLRENAAFCAGHNRPGALVQGFMSIHTLFTCDQDFCLRARRFAADSGAFFHMHLSESVYEPRWSLDNLGRLPVQVYEDWGLLGPDVLASQAVQVTPEEREILARRKVRLAHMPLSNGEVGGGIAPFPDYLQAGLNCGLGSDGYINNMFEVMRGAFLMHKAHRQDPGVMSARDVYRMATSGGADALGRPDLGRLAPGASADIIAIDTDTPTPVTPSNVYDQIVLFRNPEHVRHVMIDGDFVKKDHVLCKINREEALASLRAATERFWRF